MNVNRFKKGDRVAALAFAVCTQDYKHAAYQQYTTAPEFLVAHLPDSVTFEAACVLPLCLATAAAGLYSSDYLGLPPPSAEQQASQKQKTILIWGGSSVVGSCAIQLCAAAGLTVLTTASPNNFDYVKSLGATQVFDRADGDVVEKMVSAADGTTVVGALDAISVRESTERSAEFLHHFGPGTLITTSNRAVSDAILLGDINIVKSTWRSWHGDL
jgi:NADPH:quinone reductase-like Zn-dependent oxidoreductase